MHFSRLYKVKVGKLEVLKNWFDVLNKERRMEALATFAFENISREVFVIFSGDNGENFVVGFNEVIGELRSSDPNVKINQEHKKILQECLEPISGHGKVEIDLGI